ncbi:MAG: polyprenyl synthetase family protein [Chlamydiae bacterium]|nr:polyprenyl synthetase family protein [Chlamydiota bacterium]
MQTSSGSHFFYLRDRIEQEIAASIVSFGEKTKLRDACEYALLGEGKRLRPIIVMMVGEALDYELNVLSSALSVEFFHTASLIADDLPCMDNDDERRNKPSLHKAFGEAVALLASYALICAAFQKIHQNYEEMKKTAHFRSSNSDLACSIALECATRCAGILGATGGQYLDLFPPIINIDTIREIIYKKTITLFEVSFVFGWIFGGGEIEKIEFVKKISHHLGLAFQISDDLQDLKKDSNQQKEINIARFLGKAKASLIFQNEMALFKEGLSKLEILTPSFEKMCDILSRSIPQAASISV